MNTLLTVVNLQKCYGSTVALHNAHFSLSRGEVISLLGVNGAGKTTLSSLIATVHPPTAGDILFKGESIFNDIQTYRMRMGYCPQKNNLNPLLSNKDNLYFAGYYFGMNNIQIAARINYLDDLLEIKKYFNQTPKHLSSGWKQRYMIARTLIHSPELIILDEPTVALDPDIRRQLWEYIKFIAQTGVSVILTTHYLDEADAVSDFVCILDKGKIIRIATIKNLLVEYGKKNLEEVFFALTNVKQEEC